MAVVPELLFQDLCADVLSGRYAAGEKLPTQRALAAESGTSMTSVREAVRRLEQLGLVEVRHGDAMRVCDWRLSGGLEVIAHALVTDGEALPGLLEARRLMLGQAARLAAQRGGGAGLLEIAAQIALVVEAEDLQALDFAFFSELVTAAQNIVLSLIMNSIRRVYFDHAERFRALVDDPRSLAPMYLSAARAVAAGSAERAEREVAALAAAQEARLV